MTITLFVNGDSHTAKVYNDKGITATEILASDLGLTYKNVALPGGSNQRIIRTTLDQLPELDPRSTVIVIGWSGFERTEWYYQNHWHQICGDPYYPVDQNLKQRWRDHINAWNQDDIARWQRTTDQHHYIWTFHHMLARLGYKFLFYQGTKMSFFDGCLFGNQDYRLTWLADTWIHDPYVRLKDPTQPATESNIYRESFSWYVESKGCEQSDDRAHYGADAHKTWAAYMKPFLTEKINQLKSRQ